MSLKYVRHEEIGFVLWARTNALWHLHVGDLLQSRRQGEIVSAGFVEFGPGGVPRCFGMSESLGIASRDDDSDALAAQLGIMPANVEVTGAARLYRAASSDRRERGRPPGWGSRCAFWNFVRKLENKLQ